MKSWKKLSSEFLFESKIFKLRKDKCELPDGRIMPNYFVMEFPDWVQVIAITKGKKMVMIEQYRHAAEASFLEIPGGAMDPLSGESPEEAGLRELLEETGFSSSKIVALTSHYPNPATQMNRLHCFIAYDCEKTTEPNLDPFEDIEVKLMSIENVYKAMESGGISHSLIMASLAIARPHLLGD